MRQSVRPHLATGTTVVSACILALSLVAAPSDVNVARGDANVARTEGRAVQLATFELPSAIPLGAILEKFISDRKQTVVSVTPVAGGNGAAGITTATVTTPLTFLRSVQPTDSQTQTTTAQLVIDPAKDTQQVNALVTADVGFDPLGSLITLLSVPIILVFFLVVVPVFAVLLSIFPPVFPEVEALSVSPLPLKIPAEPDTDVDPVTLGLSAIDVDSVPSGLPDTDVDPVTLGLSATDVDSVPSGLPATDVDSVTPKGASATDVDSVTPKGASATDVDSVTPKGASATDVDSVTPKGASATDVDSVTPKGASASEPKKRADTPATHRQMVRGSLGASGQRSRDLPHSASDEATDRTDAGGNAGKTGGPSTPGSSSAGGSTGGSPADGDTDGS